MDRTSWYSVGILAAVLALVVLGGFASPRRAHAYTTPPPFTMGYGGASADGLDASGGSFGSASFTISGAGGADGTYSASTYWTGQTIGGLAIDALDVSGIFDGGLSDILSGALTAYGLYVDANGHVYTSNPNSPQYRQYAGCSQYSTACYYIYPNNQVIFGDSSSAESYAEQLIQKWQAGTSDASCTDSFSTTAVGQSFLINVSFSGTGCSGSSDGIEEAIYVPPQNAAAPPANPNQPQLASPQEIAQALAAEDPGIAPQLVNNAQGQELNTPNVQQAASQLAQQIQTQTGQTVANPEPAPASSTSPAPSSTSLINPAPSSSAPQSSPSADLPPFCSWAAVVCDFINWMETKPQQQPPQQLPVNPAPAGSSWSSGLGGGSCPAPYPFQVFGESYQLDITPICTLMTDIRGLVLAACALIAAFILSGTTRRV